jgi:tetratricopeptide (TPR) repeat protein
MNKNTMMNKNNHPTALGKYWAFIICCLVFFGGTILSGTVKAASNEGALKQAYAKSYQYEKVGDYGNAINALLIPYKSAPEDYTINLRLGYLYASNLKYANAISHYQAAHKVAPKAIPPQLGLMRIANIRPRSSFRPPLITRPCSIYAQRSGAWPVRRDNL